MLDPAQLAIAYANQQLAQQTHGQQHQGQQQLRTSAEHCEDCSTHQAPDSLQSDAVEDAAVHQQPRDGDQLAAWLGPGDESPGRTQDWQQLHAAQQWHEQESQQEEELIKMDDPMFSTLSERRQKLMALEEILLNTGIEG